VKVSHILLVIILAFATSFVSARYVVSHGNDALAAKESAYDRVLRTGVLRCGYASWDPMLIIDPNTKKASGIAAEAIDKTAQYLGLRVEWTAEYGWGDFILGLDNAQVDVFCAGPTPNADRARVASFTVPFVYGRFPFFSRADDHRFDHDMNALNRPETKIGTVDVPTFC